MPIGAWLADDPERQLTLRQADEAREDFAIFEQLPLSCRSPKSAAAVSRVNRNNPENPPNSILKSIDKPAGIKLLVDRP